MAKKTIIEPSTLTEEQREAIRKEYIKRIKINCYSPYSNGWDIELLEQLFGEDFFRKDY